MAGTNWNPQQLKTISFNPNQGLQIAQNAAKNITDTFADKRKHESLAQYRQQSLAMDERKQDYAEGAQERAIAEEERKKAQAAEEAQLVNGLAYGFSRQGGERLSNESVNAVLAQDPRWTQMSPEEQNAARTQYISENGGAAGGADPQLFQERFRQALLESDQNFSRDQINTIVASQTGRLFPTMDKDIQKALLSDNSKGGNVYVNSDGVSSGGAGSAKLLTPQTSAAGISDIAERVAEQRGLKKTPGMVPLLGARADIGKLDPAQSDIAKVASDLFSMGITSPAAIEAGINSAFDPSGKKIMDGYDFRNGTGVEKIYNYAKKAQDQERVMVNKQGQRVDPNSQVALQNQKYQQQGQILSRGSPQRLSDEQLAQRFLSRTFGDSPAQPARPEPRQPAPAVTPPPAGPVAANPNSTDPILANMGNNPAPQQAPSNSRLLSDPEANGGDPLMRGMLPEMKGGYGKFSGPETKQLNDSLQKVRLFAVAPDKADKPTVNEMEMAMEHPGTSDSELTAIEQMLKALRVDRQTSRRRGPRN